MTFNILPKCRNFAKSGHTGSGIGKVCALFEHDTKMILLDKLLALLKPTLIHKTGFFQVYRMYILWHWKNVHGWDGKKISNKSWKFQNSPLFTAYFLALFKVFLIENLALHKSSLHLLFYPKSLFLKLFS